jgi:L-fuconolactonase
MVQFGNDRVMFGSDWPVCLLAGGYDRVVEALEMNLSDVTLSEYQDVFGNCATRWYRLENRA